MSSSSYSAKQRAPHHRALSLTEADGAQYRQPDGAPKDWQMTAQGKFRDTHPANLWTDITIPFWSMPENTDHPTQKSEKLIAKNAYDATLVASPITDAQLKQTGIQNTIQGRFLRVDLDQFSPELKQPHFFETHYGLAPLGETVRLVFIGRLTPDKGWALTFEAFRQLRERMNPDRIAIIFVGAGPLHQHIQEQLGQITPHVHLLGRVVAVEIPGILANCDLHVTASQKETTGLTVLEAQAAGLPVLAPRAGGVVDYIQDGETGYLYDPQGVTDYVERLHCLIEDAALRGAMGVKAREAMASYDWAHTVTELIQVWQSEWEAY